MIRTLPPISGAADGVVATPAPVVVSPEPNPYAEWGLDSQGNRIPPTAPPPIDPAAAQAEMGRQLAEANARLAKVDGLEQKFAVIDRLLKAVQGDVPTGGSTNPDVWNDLKKIAPPKVREIFELLEKDPQAIDRLTGSVRALQVNNLVSLNERAHQRMIDVARKAGMKGEKDEDMSTMVFPFERAVTEVINATPSLQQRFLSGNLDVVDEVFRQLYAPHLSQRIKEKKLRGEPSNFPKATPRGGAAPSTSSGDTAKPNIHTPAGKASFHKGAVNRWFAKMSAASDE